MPEYQELLKQADQLAQNRESAKAIQLYNQAIECKPQQASAYYNLALLYHQQGQLDEAIANFEKAAELNPGDAFIFNNLGVLYYSKKMLKKAEGSFRKAINIEPDYADALHGLGKVCQKHAETDGSQKLEQHISEVKNRIETLYGQDRIEEARQISKKLIELSPDDAENQNDYAVLCYELDKIEEAREAIDNAQKLAPEDENVRANYQMIYSDNWKDWKGEIDL